jgi:hypothetical protein
MTVPQEKPEQEAKPKRKGNPMIYKGHPGLPGAGRPRLEAEREKPTNRVLRQKEFLSLVRKFRPYQTKAIQAVVKIIDNQESADQNKLKASAILLNEYRTLLKELYDAKYDEEQAEEIQQENTPVFHLKMVSGEEKPEDTAKE